MMFTFAANSIYSRFNVFFYFMECQKIKGVDYSFNYTLSSKELKFLCKLLRYVFSYCPFSSYRNKARILYLDFTSIVFNEKTFDY